MRSLCRLHRNRCGSWSKGVIEVRQGDGFEVLAAGEADTVTIAGMGGSLMAIFWKQGIRLGS